MEQGFHFDPFDWNREYRALWEAVPSAFWLAPTGHDLRAYNAGQREAPKEMEFLNRPMKTWTAEEYAQWWGRN